MAAYNAQDYLDTALNSVFAQSFKDYEVVVVDDASSDKTPHILAACQDPRLKVFRNETRSGAAFSRNRAKVFSNSLSAATRLKTVLVACAVGRDHGKPGVVERTRPASVRMGACSSMMASRSAATTLS